MKHAGHDTVGKLRPLLVQLRKRSPLREKSAGVFYLKSKAFLHFHDDPEGIFADVKLDLTTYSRCRVTTAKEQKVLFRSIDKCLSSSAFSASHLRGWNPDEMKSNPRKPRIPLCCIRATLLSPRSHSTAEPQPKRRQEIPLLHLSPSRGREESGARYWSK
jgi:hypothetical protein